MTATTSENTEKPTLRATGVTGVAGTTDGAGVAAEAGTIAEAGPVTEVPEAGEAGEAGEVGGVGEKVEIRALQAMCRQVFGLRLAMIAVATPAALLNASPGLGARLVGSAVVVTFMISYVLFRDWQRFGPLLLRHPTLLAADSLFGSLLLISAGPDTTLAYVSVCTPLLAGLLYSWRGAAVFASLQSLILLVAQETLKHHSALAESLLLPGLCVITGAMGSALRNLMLRFGAATEALTETRARLAASEAASAAASAERARLAREMHDSVTKTLYGVALVADGLAASAAATPDRLDPALIRQQAELLARAARQAAAESRALLTDLRAEADADDVLPRLQSLTAAFTARTALRAEYEGPATPAPVPLPPPTVRQLLGIVAEALENAYRHAHATRVDVRAAATATHLVVTIQDDGRGLPAHTTLEDLRRTGHFGLLGMTERAASVGARIQLTTDKGTKVRVEVPRT
ncbi:sensor histidine kinase [Streptomyces fuscichromogenes]|uniref:sensor histidine kinase n=1 Tax=Streptomyces fuscichromogenes TaxID=1324013 RepID=UPI00381A4711